MPYSPRDDSPDSRGRYGDSPKTDAFGRELPNERLNGLSTADHDVSRSRSRSRSRSQHRRSFSRSRSRSHSRSSPRRNSYNNNNNNNSYNGGYRRRGRRYNNYDRYNNNNNQSSRLLPSIRPHVRSVQPMQTYKNFLVSLDDDINPESALEKYHNYQKEYVEKVNEEYFKEHVKEEWFRERYFDAERERKICELNEVHDRIYKEIIEKNIDLHILKINPNNNNSNENKSSSSSTTTATTTEADESDKNNKDLYIEPNIIFLQNIPPTVSREQFNNLFNKYDGFIESYFSDPSQFPPKYFFRFGWIVFDTSENANNVLSKCGGQHLQYVEKKDFIFNGAINKSRPPSMLPYDAINRLEKDFKQIRHLINELDKTRNYELTFESLLSNENISKLSIRNQMKIAVYYLKRVFLYSYYSGVQYHDYGQIIFNEGPYYFYCDEYNENNNSSSQNNNNINEKSTESMEIEENKPITTATTNDNNTEITTTTTTSNESTSIDKKEKEMKVGGVDDDEDDDEEEEIEGEEGEIKSTSFRSPYSYPSNWGTITDTNYENRLEYINIMSKLFNETVDGNSDMLEQSFYEQNIKKTNKESFGMCFACVFCDKKFEEKKYAEKHQKLKHNEKIEEFIQQDKFIQKAKNIFLNDPLRYVPIEKERLRKNKLNNREMNNGALGGSYRRRSYYSYRDPDDTSSLSSTSKGKSLINYGDI